MANVQFDLDLFGSQELPAQPEKSAAERNRRYRIRLAERAVIVPPLERVCSKCHEKKDAAFFDKNAQSKSGLALYCKACKSLGFKARVYRLEKTGYLTRTEKLCSRCGVVKPASDFSNTAASCDGLNIWCRICSNIDAKKHYYANRDTAIKRQTAYAKAKPELTRSGSIASRCAARARKVGAEGRFTAAEWRKLLADNDNKCFYCKRPGTEERELTADHMLSMSRGGTNWITNIAPACFRCNGSKGNKTPEEFAVWRSNQE